jgi:hypothetical protein
LFGIDDKEVSEIKEDPNEDIDDNFPGLISNDIEYATYHI